MVVLLQGAGESGRTPLCSISAAEVTILKVEPGASAPWRAVSAPPDGLLATARIEPSRMSSAVAEALSVPATAFSAAAWRPASRVVVSFLFRPFRRTSSTFPVDPSLCWTCVSMPTVPPLIRSPCRAARSAMIRVSDGYRLPVSTVPCRSVTSMPGARAAPVTIESPSASAGFSTDGAHVMAGRPSAPRLTVRAEVYRQVEVSPR